MKTRKYWTVFGKANIDELAVFWDTTDFCTKLLKADWENINYCVRGGHKPARWPWPCLLLKEMEKWSWIRIRNPISTKIELVLEVHPLLPSTKFGGESRSWDILRTNSVRTDRQTDTHRWPQDLAAYGTQVINQQEEKEECKCYTFWQMMEALLHSNGQLRTERDGHTHTERKCQKLALHWIWQNGGTN